MSLASKSHTIVSPAVIANVVKNIDKHTSRVVRLSNLSVEDVFGVVWQGKNNLFCTVQFMQWEYKTTTVPEAADAASWLGETIDLPFPDIGRDHTKPLGPLVVSIYHENLVVADKLIAQAEIPLISIFEGEVSSSEYICESKMSVEQTAFDGVKFKRKPKGIVKFNAQIVFSAFDPARSNTKRIEDVVVPPLQGSIEGIRLDSTSGSLMTHSINPETFREDSMYDFSAQQLREAVHLLQEWEDPSGKNSSEKRESASASRASLHTASRPISRSASAKDVTKPIVEAKAKAPATLRNPALSSDVATSKKNSPELRESTSAKRSIRTEPGTTKTPDTDARTLVEAPVPTTKDALNRTAPAAITRPVSAGGAAVNSNNSSTPKPVTRLRNRRSSAADDTKNTKEEIDYGKNESKSKVRRGSIGYD